MAPENLKVGDTFIDGKGKYKVLEVLHNGFAKYNVELIGLVNEPEKAPEKEETIEVPTEEEKPVGEPETDVKEEVQEEEKKPAPRRAPAKKKTTRTTTKR